MSTGVYRAIKKCLQEERSYARESSRVQRSSGVCVISGCTHGCEQDVCKHVFVEHARCELARAHPTLRVLQC